MIPTFVAAAIILVIAHAFWQIISGTVQILHGLALIASGAVLYFISIVIDLLGLSNHTVATARKVS